MSEGFILDNLSVRSRSKRLKAASGDTHDRLDKAIMGHEPFSSRERYGLFIKAQHAFHRDIDVLYDDAALDMLLPDLQGRRRLPQIEQDLVDLGMGPLAFDAPQVFTPGAVFDLPTALGWFYVAEGSNMGAAFLLKWAKEKLGLSEEFGARHLAGAPEGRGLHWRTFTAALDEIALSEAEEARVVAGAQAAFRRVHGLVDAVFG